jgi:hypothetical protein
MRKECTFFVPADIERYIQCTDYALYHHLEQVSNPWARRLMDRKPFRMLFELHSNKATGRPKAICSALEAAGIEVIHSSSQARLSKYHSGSEVDKALQIYVVDKYDYRAEPYPIEESTEIFKRYEDIRQIDRIYVAPEEFDRGEKLLIEQRI